MPTVYTFFAIDRARLTSPISIEATHRDAVHWETVESRAFDGFADIDRAFDGAVTGRRYGPFSPDETKAVAAALGAATDELLGRLEENPLVARFYWAMRRTAEAAAGQGLCMTVRYTDDDEEQAAAGQEEAERIRAEDEEAAATALEEIAPHLARARALVAELDARKLIEISGRASREEIARQFAEHLADRDGDPGHPDEVADWFIDHGGIEDVFGDDEAFRSALEHADRAG